MATGNEDPDVEDGLVETSDRMSIRPSHLRLTAHSASMKWKLRSHENQNVFYR